MHYGEIKSPDIANGEGCRVSLFVSGCEARCDECFNPETWNFEYGEEFNNKVLEDLIEKLRPEYISGLTILGGEPLHPKNYNEVLKIVRKVNEVCGGEKTIWLYTGYTFEEIRERCDELLQLIDVLVDGKFIKELKNLMLEFRGSENQRIINIKESLKNNKIILKEFKRRN